MRMLLAAICNLPSLDVTIPLLGDEHKGYKGFHPVLEHEVRLLYGLIRIHDVDLLQLLLYRYIGLVAK